MITELAMESVMILTHETHPCLEKIYYLNGQFTDPWKALPDYDNIIKPFLEKPLTIEKYNESKEFSIRVNASLDAANDFWRACFKPQTEMFGANLLAATNEFSQDIVLNDVTDYCHDYMKNVSEPCKVFLTALMMPQIFLFLVLMTLSYLMSLVLIIIFHSVSGLITELFSIVLLKAILLP